MPSVEQFLQAKADIKRSERLAAEKAEAEKALKPIHEHLQRLERLSADEDLKWFTEVHLQPIHDAAQDGALNVNNSAAERNDQAQRRHTAEQMLKALEKATAALRSALIQPSP